MGSGPSCASCVGPNGVRPHHTFGQLCCWLPTAMARQGWHRVGPGGMDCGPNGWVCGGGPWGAGGSIMSVSSSLFPQFGCRVVGTLLIIHSCHEQTYKRLPLCSTQWITHKTILFPTKHFENCTCVEPWKVTVLRLPPVFCVAFIFPPISPVVPSTFCKWTLWGRSQKSGRLLRRTSQLGKICD